MTEAEINREWVYRYTEALALGRTEAQARKEADEWKESITKHDQPKTTT